ncbi:MAG: hypothetical protein KF760_18405 [Candidatus Eremiobacteraeota bacterium]|nr:hypothetical protein [Candidatus Eremiobacteraeota bacterium]MCW5869373.1 hypothetical protein [Candidatus Eremiobacteraeota bacterium]
MHIINPVTQESIRQAIEEWVNLLVEEKYTEASAYIVHEEGTVWPPEMLKEIITDYSSRAQVNNPKVTDPATASGGPQPRHDIKMSSFNPKYVGEAWWDIPISGSWSDLTATFLVKEHEKGATLVLEDFRVM